MKEKKFVPFEKMSKRKQREINNSKRNTWGDFDPTTRVEQLGYNRKKKKEVLRNKSEKHSTDN